MIWIVPIGMADSEDKKGKKDGKKDRNKTGSLPKSRPQGRSSEGKCVHYNVRFVCEFQLMPFSVVNYYWRGRIW